MKRGPDKRRHAIFKWSIASLALLAVSSFALPKYLIWNASASLPKGFYLILSDDNIRHGQIAVVNPPPALARWMAQRRYLPAGVPLLKTVAATSGNRVCRVGNVISFRSQNIATAKTSDRMGRPLPVWQGCKRIGDDELFLINDHHADSLDSRYFGPLPAKNILGRAVPIWTQDNE